MLSLVTAAMLERTSADTGTCESDFGAGVLGFNSHFEMNECEERLKARS